MKCIHFIILLILLYILHWPLESLILRPYRKYTYFRMAQKLAKKKNKKLVVVGDPYSGAGTTQFIQNTARKLGFELYGCGDFCIDITGCPKCKNKTNKSLEIALKKIPDNSSVVFISGTLEYVDADMNEMVKDLYRISGGDLFIVTINDMTGHYAYGCKDNDCTTSLKNIFTQKSKRFITKAPPEYDHFEWKDKK